MNRDVLPSSAEQAAVWGGHHLSDDLERTVRAEIVEGTARPPDATDAAPRAGVGVAVSAPGARLSRGRRHPGRLAHRARTSARAAARTGMARRLPRAGSARHRVRL